MPERRGMEIQVIDEGPKVSNVKIGDIVKIQEEDEDGAKVFVEYKVVKLYPYQVLAMADRGRKKRYFGYGDLVTMGKECPNLNTAERRNGRKDPRHTFDRTGMYGG